MNRINNLPIIKKYRLSFLIALTVLASSLGVGAFMRQAPTHANATDGKSGKTISGSGDATPNSSGNPGPQAVTVATYPFTSSSGVPLEDMSSGTTQLVAANQEDTASTVNNIGFDFWFDGVRRTQFSANANGLIRLGSSAVSTLSANDLTNTVNLPQIAPYWDDLFTGTNGKVHFKVVGSAPNRKLVIEWQNMQIPRVGANNAGAGTFQCWLSETTGLIEFVYGSGIVLNTANSGYSVGFGSSGTAFASVTTSVPSAAYGTANNTQTNAITSGTKYTFTPLTPADPTVLNFTAVTQTAMTLNWTDNSSNELGFAVYRSDDGGSTYQFVTQTAANATSSTQSPLLPGTNYFWKVFAVTEGALSTNPAAGSNSTNAAGNIISTASGGDWSSTATWVGGAVPTANDNVTIADGATVNIDIDTATCFNLTVGQGSSGILQYANTPGTRILTVNNNVTVAAGGTFTAGSGSFNNHVLNIGGTSQSLAAGNLTVDGTFDLNTSAGVTTNFLGSANATISGGGPTCDFFAIVVNKGLTNAPVLDVTRAITTNAPTGSVNRLVITSGTFKLSSASTITPYSGSQPICAANGRLWINNSAATITSNGVGTTSNAGAPTILGTLQVDAGTWGYGSGNNTMIVSGTMIIGGANATVNMFGPVSFQASSTFTMTAGNFNVDVQAGNSVASGSQDTFVFITGSTVTFSGGTLTLVDPHPTNTNTSNADFRVAGAATNRNFTGSTVRLGDGTSASSGNATTGGFQLSAPSNLALGTIIVNNPSGTNRNVRINASVSVTCNLSALTVTAGTFNLNGNTLGITGDILNDGTINGDVSGSLLNLVGGLVQTISGSGGYTNGRIRSVALANTSGGSPAVNQNQNFAVTTALNLNSGSLGGSGTLTIGDSGASTTLTTTRSGGSLANTPAFNLAGVTYNVTYTAPSPAAAITTGTELPGSISGTLTINNASGVTLNSPLTADGNLSLGSGLLTTTATNLLTLRPAVSGPAGSVTSYVNGPLAITIPTTVGISRTYAIGKGAFFRPVTLSSLSLAGQATVAAEVVNSPSGGTPVAPLTTLDPARYWQLSNSAALNAAARIRLTYDSDDNVFDTVPARVAQSSTANGSYSSIGGSVTGTTISGTIISTANLTPGNDFFTIGNESALPIGWDGGAATTNWGDAANWTNDTVPTSTTDVSLSFGSPTIIDVNGTFSVKNLTIGTNTTLNFGSGTLNVTGNYIQSNGTLNINTGNFNVTGTSSLNGGSTNVNSGAYLSTGAFSVGGGTLANGSGTLNCKADFTLTSGSFTVVAGASGATTIFSGTAIQNIAGFTGGTSLNNVTLQGGGAGVPKRFTAGRTITAANDVVVATSAQISLSSAGATTINIGGNLNYAGVTGGANIGSLTLNLTGTNKTINGTLVSAPQLGGPTFELANDKTEVVNLITDPAKFRGVPKNKIQLENTYAQKRDQVKELIGQKKSDIRLIINLDDATVISNPATLDPLAPTPSPFEMNLTVASGASYTLLDNLSIATGRTLSVTGRLNADTFTIGGAGNVTVTGSSVTVGNGTIGTATTSASGLAATLTNTGVNTFTDAIIEYNAAAGQTVNVTNHPAAAMIYTAGSGTKTLNGNKTITGDSGDALTKGALFVGAGTTFADGGFTLSFTSPLGFDNVIVNGTYLSTGSGGISYESGPTFSSILALDGTQFGNLTMNFDFSDDAITLNASGTANIGFRNLTFGGTAGLGTAGGTLLVNQTGTTNVIVNGNVSISPLTTSNNGGGFGGTASTVGTVTVKGNITSTSTATTQPIFDNTGTNTLIMGHPSTLQTLTLGANSTIFTGSNLQIDNPAGMQIGGTGRTITLGSGGMMLVSAGASFFTGSNIFINSGATTVNGSFVINTGGAASGGAGTYSYHATLGTLVFNTTSTSTIDSARTYWPASNGPQNVSVIGTSGITMSVPRTVGILFQTTAGVAGAGNLTFNGTCKINTGGSFTGAPTYGSSSLLIYNTGGTFNRGAEWSATAGAGFPNDVQLSSSTTLDVGAGGNSTACGIARDLTIDAGSTLTTNVAGNRMTAAMTVPGNLLINGSMVLSTMAGGNVNVGGNWTNNSTFTSNGRTVSFNGSTAQIIGGSVSSAFGGLTISNSAGVAMNVNASVSGVLTLTTNLTTGAFVVTQSGTSAGTADVIGNVSRSDLGAVARAFGNPFNTIAVTAGSVPANIVVNLVDGSPGDFANAVRRAYTVTPSAGGFTGTLQLHYNDSELNGNVEATLDLWRSNGSVWTDQGATTRDPANNFVQLTGVTQFSPWALASGGNVPTAVKLTKFNAASYADGVQLTWDSGFEVDNLGYHLYREQQGKRTRVTPAVIAGSALKVGPGRRLTAGFSYSWFDKKGTAETAYYLEAIDLNGSRQWTGPIYPYSGTNAVNSAKPQRALLLNEVAGTANAGAHDSERAWPAAMKAQDRNAAMPIKPAGLSVQQSIAAGNAVKIQVNRTGWYRLSQAELVAAGLNPLLDSRLLQLYVDGTEVPVELSNNGPRFNIGDTLEFYGVALDTTTTDTRTYWLIAGNSPGKRISAKRAKVIPGNQNFTDGTATGSFLYTVERREKLIYSSHLLNGDAENIFGAPVLSEPVKQILTVSNLDSESTLESQLEVVLQGLTAQAHEVMVQLNGSDAGVVTFNSSDHPSAKFDISRALLKEGDNEISLVSRNGDLDISFIDSIRLTYPHKYRADNNALGFSVKGGQTVRVSGFTSPNVRVIDVTDPSWPTEFATGASPSQGGYSVMVSPTGSDTRTLIAFTEDLSRHPAAVSANNPSAWNASTNGADMVIITYKDFSQAIEPLAALRRSQGLVVAVIDVEDLYDEFSYGAHTPSALRSFLASAAANWSRKPEYLLLVGDSTWDPRNYFDQGFNDFVPTKLIDTGYMETASDDWLVDFSNSGLPGMAIGRLPARTASEANLMVSKILTYEQERELNAPLRGAVMVADTGFESQSVQTSGLLPGTVDVQTINRSDLANDDVTRGQIVNALNDGPMIVNYYGHGSIDVWTGANLLDSDLALNLTNTNRVSLFVMMTCLNGYSHDPFLDSLGEAALKAQHGGAVAVWASSGFTDSQPQLTMDLEFYRQLFGAEPVRLGQAIRLSKGAISDQDVRRTWILFGDPAMRVR